MPDQYRLLADLRAHGLATDESHLQPCSGGDTHQAYKLRSYADESTRFIKVAAGSHADVLSGEYESLQHMERLFPNVYPRPIQLIDTASYSILAMEYFELRSLKADEFSRLGHLLAQQHQVRGDQFGWPSDNHIGLTPQLNSPSSNWAEFYWERRLEPQLAMAQNNGLPVDIWQKLRALKGRIEKELEMNSVQPALLHGDLWAGNVAYNNDRQQPLMFDPAPYFGDPEADLAMTHLFGDFPPEFYRAYDQSGFRREGHERRRAIYELYHALNHYNLFGHTYLTIVSQKTGVIAERFE